jgi:hypothetical protein
MPDPTHPSTGAMAEVVAKAQSEAEKVKKAVAVEDKAAEEVVDLMFDLLTRCEVLWV